MNLGIHHIVLLTVRYKFEQNITRLNGRQLTQGPKYLNTECQTSLAPNTKIFYCTIFASKLEFSVLIILALLKEYQEQNSFPKFPLNVHYNKRLVN